MSKKKIGIIAGVIISVLIIGGLGIYFISGAPVGGGSESKVYVEKVSSVIGLDAGAQSRFNGVVETQDAHEIKVDSSRKIAKIHVSVNDEIKVGQTLVTYDTSELELQMALAALEVESINNEIASCVAQINILAEQSADLPAEDQMYYQSEIQNYYNDISQKQFDVQSKQLEIAKYQEEINESVVVSDVSGIVRAINEDEMDASGNTAPFMSVSQGGEYRVKGTIDEQNIWTLSEGQSVILRSRVDESITWTGSIDKIDTENPMQQNNDYYYEGGDSIRATKYPFYITVDNLEGLILGQHVYVELNEGQTEEKEGIWLSSSYLVMEEDSTYVWASNSREKLEKRTVEVGEYDETLDQYQIVAGITEEDYICWPMEGLYEGVTTVTDMAEQVWGIEGDFSEEMGMDEEFLEEEFDMGEEFPEEMEMDEEIPGEEMNEETEFVEEME